MPRLTKQQLLRISNADFALNTDFSNPEIELAFSNFNRLIDAVRSSSDDEEQRLAMFLQRTETAGVRDLGESGARAALELGRLDSGIGELAAIPGVGMATLCNMIPALVALDLSDDPVEVTKTGPRTRRNKAPRSHYSSTDSAQYLNTIATTLTTPVAFSFLPDALDDFINDLTEDLKKVRELGEEGRDTLRAGKDILKELKEAKKALTDRRPGAVTNPREAGGSVVRAGAPTAEQIDGEIADDTYRQLFGEVLDNEPLYTVWLDRLMAFEVDGAGDDNVFWTVESSTFLKNPDKVIRTSFVSNVYNIDEREEYRLKPSAPTTDRRAKPLASNKWTIRGFLEKRDASLALRVKGDVRGIPLSKLDKVVIDFYLYESDSVRALIRAVAAVGAAAIAALGIVQGKFTAPAGSTKEASDALERALNRLNELINSDDKIFDDSFTFKGADFESAYKTGQTFRVRQRQTLAAMGLSQQRAGGGERENDEVVDTESADAFFARNRARLSDPEFYEDEFESYYEWRLRFEREDPDTTTGQ